MTIPGARIARWTVSALIVSALSSHADEARFLTETPADFTAEGKVSFYNRANLYEYIDGAAVFYNSYGFVRLEHGVYKKGDDTYVVDVYELGSPLSSFGAYRQQREDTAKPLVGAGVEGAIIDYLTVFYKDKFYVEVIPQKGGDLPAMEGLAKWLDARLPGTNTLPPEISLFPPEGLVAGSERSVDESLISYSFMGRGITAVYKFPGAEKEIRVFVALSPGPDKAKELLEGFRGKMSEPKPFTAGGAEGVRGDLPYRGQSAACVSGPYLYGAMGFGDEGKATALLAALGEKLKAFGK